MRDFRLHSEFSTQRSSLTLCYDQTLQLLPQATGARTNLKLGRAR